MKHTGDIPLYYGEETPRRVHECRKCGRKHGRRKAEKERCEERQQENIQFDEVAAFIRDSDTPLTLTTLEPHFPDYDVAHILDRMNNMTSRYWRTESPRPILAGWALEQTTAYTAERD